LLRQYQLELLGEKVNILLNNYLGFNEYIEHDVDYPVSYVKCTLEEAGAITANRRYGFILDKLSIMPCFFYRIARGNVFWNPLKQPLIEFDPDGISNCWKDFNPYPSPVAVRDWFLGMEKFYKC